MLKPWAEQRFLRTRKEQTGKEEIQTQKSNNELMEEVEEHKEEK